MHYTASIAPVSKARAADYYEIGATYMLIAFISEDFIGDVI